MDKYIWGFVAIIGLGLGVAALAQPMNPSAFKQNCPSCNLVVKSADAGTLNVSTLNASGDAGFFGNAYAGQSRGQMFDFNTADGGFSSLAVKTITILDQAGSNPSTMSMASQSGTVNFTQVLSTNSTIQAGTSVVSGNSQNNQLTIGGSASSNPTTLTGTGSGGIKITTASGAPVLIDSNDSLQFSGMCDTRATSSSYPQVCNQLTGKARIAASAGAASFAINNSLAKAVTGSCLATLQSVNAGCKSIYCQVDAGSVNFNTDANCSTNAADFNWFLLSGQ